MAGNSNRIPCNRLAGACLTAIQISALVLAAGVLSIAAQAQPAPQALTLSKTIPLPGVVGKFDHFAVDLAGHRLFVAATGNHSVEVIDLKAGKVEQSILGLGKPHGLAWVDGSLYVSDGAHADLSVYRGTPLMAAGNIKLSEDADDMVYDPARQRLYVGHGGGEGIPGRVAVVDTAKFSLVENIPVATHPEALDLDQKGHRVFANIADSAEVAVIDEASNAVAAHWKLKDATNNVPMAFNAARHVLYVACRKPAVLLALDAATGAELGRASSAAGVDDLFFDEALGRLYLIAGSGEVDAYKTDGGKMEPLGATRTLPGAKTALFVPSDHALYVGVPSAGENPAEIRVYSTPR